MSANATISKQVDTFKMSHYLIFNDDSLMRHKALNTRLILYFTYFRKVQPFAMKRMESKQAERVREYPDPPIFVTLVYTCLVFLLYDLRYHKTKITYRNLKLSIT